MSTLEPALSRFLCVGFSLFILEIPIIFRTWARVKSIDSNE